MDERLAELLLDYCLEAGPGDEILLEAETPALPLLRALFPAALDRGAYLHALLAYPGQTRALLERGGAWLDAPPEGLRALYGRAHKFLRVLSAENPFELSGLPPQALRRHRLGHRALAEERLKKRWALTLYPTPGYAAQAGMSTEDFLALYRKALFLDQDPLLRWRALSAFQEELIARLSRAKTLRVQAPGTDLTLRVEGRTWINSDGRRNMPSGEVFTGPWEDSAEGEVRFNLPLLVQGVRVRGAWLRFKEGRVVAAGAQEGEEVFLALLETDEGARRLGEVGIGTNYGIDRPTGLVLLDEKIGGSLHLALGNSYPETGGKNRSALHLDLVLDLRPGGAVYLDGVLFQENGRFV
ncbi:aminopeptidase [Thermus filiformis]|uniref:Aminopeptidase n=1 Tax=Thermus filiformis TaxID=276 RepID=A0A0A2WUB6_THEFI|nr:aminopeptidase [Thermus filiformis]KGQ22367.2 aminopeptidase [Thermus filiformis]